MEYSNGASWSIGQDDKLLAINQELVNLVPKDVAYTAQLAPFKLKGRVLQCLGNPGLHRDVVRKFEARIYREIEILEASPETVAQTLLELYGPNLHEDAAELIEAIAKDPKRRKGLSFEDKPRQVSGPMRVIAVTSGKGGVGKSSTTANLATVLASRGYRVGLVDCDFGLSNLHLMLGMKPTYSISDVLAKRVSILDAFEQVNGGLYLLAGPVGATEYVDLNYSKLQEAGAGFSSLDPYFDFLLLDTAAGIHEGVMSLLLAADETVLVTTPDPAAVLDAYVIAQALLNRRPGAMIRCIVNQATNESDAKQIFAKFMVFLGMNSVGNASFLGSVRSDKAVSESVRSRTPVWLGSPKSHAARDLQMIAFKLAGISDSAEKSYFLERFFARNEAA
jgi:flagellar biosynthesis protein FlhG